MFGSPNTRTGSVFGGQVTEVVVKYVNDLKKFLESSNIFERQAFLGTFIDNMEVNDGEITFNYGLPPDGAKQETVSVLGIVPSGPPIFEAKKALKLITA